MYELIPIVAGACAGLLGAGMAEPRSRGVAIGGIAVVAGTAAAVLSGELAESWLFLLWDIAQALVCGVLVYLAASRLAPGMRRRRAQP